MSGHVGDLSPQQQEALGQLRAAVADLPKPEDDDYFYLRWLRARKFNLRKSEEMLRKHLQVRKKMGIDTTLKDWTPPEVLQKFLPGGFFGEDREGHPVWYDNYGGLDPRGLHKSTRREDVLKLKAQQMERAVQLCRECSEKRGKRIETITGILDFENLSIQRHGYWPGIDMLREILSFIEQNYPERAKRVFVLKAPAIFAMGYNLVKPFIDERTRQKMVFAGDDWKEQLQKYIAPDQLPEAYGGTRCEPDPWCTDYLNQGGDIPPEYYLTNCTETSREDMEKVTVRRASSHQVECLVDEPQSVLSWEFLTTSHDIGFGLSYKLDEGKEEEVIPVKRKNSSMVPEAGFHTCETTGTYVMKFDNTYSWIYSKELLYSIKVLPPELEPEISSPLQADPDVDQQDLQTS